MKLFTFEQLYSVLIEKPVF